MDKICSHYDEFGTNESVRARMSWMLSVTDPDFKEGNVPVKRVKCPECGRRLKQRITFCHDGCCVIYAMPRHKRKGWQKGVKKTSRDRKVTKRRMGRRAA